MKNIVNDPYLGLQLDPRINEKLSKKKKRIRQGMSRPDLEVKARPKEEFNQGLTATTNTGTQFSSESQFLRKG